MIPVIFDYICHIANCLEWLKLLTTFYSVFIGDPKCLLYNRFVFKILKHVDILFVAGYKK